VKIANPFWSYPHVRADFDDGKCVMVMGSQREIEVPEGSQICLIQPLAGGRSDAQPITTPAVWTPKYGVQSLEAYQEGARVAKEREELEAEKKAMADRKAKEARERVKETVSEKPKKVVEEKTTNKVEEKSLDMGKKLEL